jgi:hypothetical protein
MFVPVYEARMTARASDDPRAAVQATELVARYREASFTLLVGLTARLLPEVDGPTGGLDPARPAWRPLRLSPAEPTA